MVEKEDVSKGDILEISFYSFAMNKVIYAGVDVVHVGENVIIGDVEVVKNMPFDALEGDRVYLNVYKEEVRHGESSVEPRIGTDLQLESI